MSEELFHQDQPLSEVLQQVSNQLRFSLGNIHNALSRLNTSGDQEELDAAVLYQSYYRILRLANNLSDASEPERPEGEGLANDDIVMVCQEMMDRVEGPAALLGIQLDFRRPRNGQIIAMNRTRIERLLLNLLSNAFKFMGEGERRVTLEVRVEPGYVYLSLTDTGRGISGGQLATVFDRCRQPGRLDPPPHGLGLGLPICQRIAREHGGSLALTSQEGKGTTVVLSLPNRRVYERLRELTVDLTGGFNPTLVELSDVLPKQAFTRKYLD